MLTQKINQQGSWLHNGFMLHTVDGEPYRNSGKIDLSSHAQLASIRASQDSCRNYFFQTADFVQSGAKKESVFECHTPTSSRSQYLSEKSPRSSVKNQQSLFSTNDFALDKYNTFPL